MPFEAPSPTDVERQIAWEAEGVRRGVEAYNLAAADRDPMLLAPGRALIRGVVGPLIERIDARKAELTASLGKAGRSPSDAWPLLSIASDKAAVITLHAAVGGVTRALHRPACGAVTKLAITIAEGISDQIAHDVWVEKQKDENKEAAKRAKLGPFVARHTDLLKAFELAHPNADRRAWAKWRAKLDLVDEGGWVEDVSVTVPLGAALIALLVEAAPDRFQVTSEPLSKGFQYMLTTTKEVGEMMADVHQRAGLARPRRLPMLIPPTPWAYVETAE